MRCLRRALRALRGLAGCAQEGACHSPHRRRAVGGRFQQVLGALTEDPDRLFQLASLFLLLGGAALQRGEPPFGDVLVRIDPAAAAYRPVRERDDAAVLHLVRGAGALSLRDAGRGFGRVSIRVAGEGPRRPAVLEQVAQRAAGRDLLGLQAVDFQVAFITQHQPRRGIQHAQALRHVVERRRQQPVLPAQAMNDECAGRAHAEQGQHRALNDPARYRRQKRQEIGADNREARPEAEHARADGEQQTLPDRQRGVMSQHRSASQWLTELSLQPLFLS